MPRLLIFTALLIFLGVIVQLQLVSIAFEKLGLSRLAGYGLLGLTLLGSMINVPLYTVVANQMILPPEKNELLRLFGLPPLVLKSRMVIAVNLGGAVTPVMFSFYLLLHQALPVLQVLGVVAVVTALSYLASTPVKGVGICMPFLIAPLTAAFASLLINPDIAAPLAYIGGTLGVLIGADLLRLGSIRDLEAPIVSIGGAGTFDGIFLSGLLAVLLTY